MKRIVVGMSGGVDSSVAALLLQQQGWDVVGVFMKNWEDSEAHPNYRQVQNPGCSWEQDAADVRAVCEQLNIPYLTFNFVREYRDAVFHSFITELEAGRTPNPDIACNQEIKFRLFLEKALAMPDVDAIATGHYAAIVKGNLCRPVDRAKDQTYFLYRMERSALSQVHFPLANLTKQEVRAIAHEHGFPNADKKDSVGICFIGDIDYRSFINQHIQKKPGAIETADGNTVGQHEGLHFYTIGQRRGIHIGGTGPYYVIRKDLKRNVLIVTNHRNDPDLFQQHIRIEKLHWLVDTPPSLPFSCKVQIRYRQEAQPARIEPESNGFVVHFDTPQRAVTPGQSAVFYDGAWVLGGGILSSGE